MSKFPSVYTCLLALAAGLILGECFSFWNFMADDAYILMRYAMNLNVHGQWVYNINDYITAMTSPFHGMVEAILYFITGELPITNKIVSLIVFLIISLIGYRFYRTNKLSQLMFVVLFSTSPFVVFWTMGGLETPYLSLLLFALIVTSAKLIEEYTVKRLRLLTLFAGLCFICRYDSILFIGFLFPFLFMKFGWKRAVAWGMLASIIPILWFLFSYKYFGDIFPTSFYEKHPNYSDKVFLLRNLNYIIDFLITSGIALVFILAFTWSFMSKELRSKMNMHFRTYWFTYAGMYAFLLYGLGSATLHMMFSYRMFVPYIPVLAFLIANLVKQMEEINRSRYFLISFSSIALAVIVWNTLLTDYIVHEQINPCRNPSDYGQTSLKDYMSSQQALEDSGKLISEHWKSQPQSAQRGPRILTPAEGVVAYANPDAYVMGYLVSYRKNYNFMQATPVADYFVDASLIPNPMIPNAQSSMERIFDRSSPIYGLPCHWYIYFKSGITTANPIPNTIDGTERKQE